MNDLSSNSQLMTKRISVLAGAILIQLILGTIYGYSIFWQPLQSEVALDQSYLKYAFSICILSFAVTMVLAGRIQDIKGPRFPAICGGLLMGLGFLLAGFMSSPILFQMAHAAFIGAMTILLLMIYHALFGTLDSEKMPILKYIPMGIVTSAIVAGVTLGNLYVGKNGQWDNLFMLWGTLGFLAGAGIGFAYVCPLAALVKWFPNRKGLVSGVAVAGFGFGAYLFSNDGIAWSAESYLQSHSISNLFVVHGLVCLVGVILGAFLLCNPPANAATSGMGMKENNTDSHWQETLQNPKFYLIWVMFFSGAMAGLMVIGILKPFAGEQLVKAARAAGSPTEQQIAQWMLKGTSAVGVLAIFNAVGRVAWGFISDWIGRTGAFVAMFTLQAITLFCLGQAQTEWAISVATALVGFNFGGNFALFPSVTADLFGAKNLGVNYGWVFTAYGLAGVSGIAAGNAAYHQTGNYQAAFTLAGVLCLISAGLAIVLHLLQKRTAQILA